MKRVLVLGCGPTGLIAAATAQLHGAQVTVWSRKARSPIYGAQWLQEAIPGVTGTQPDGAVVFVLMGSREGYAKKVFGHPNHPSGWDNHKSGALVPAWDLRLAYDKLWSDLEHLIVDKELDAEEIARLDWHNFDHIFNCIPLWNICSRYKPIRGDDGYVLPAHTFSKYKVLIQPSHPSEVEGNIVVYNGREEDPWFRSSSIFGVDGGYEYPITANVQNATMVRKPQYTDCTCWSRIIRVGRYGSWSYKGLVHDAHHHVKAVLA